MAEFPLIPLTPTLIEIDSDEFNAICGWPFSDRFVGRVLRDDIPQRLRLNIGWIWIYRDRAGRLVGFGSLTICDDYSIYNDGHHHPYIPILAVNPTLVGCGYGTAILRHLVSHAALLTCNKYRESDVLFLDVYVSNVNAIRLYEKCGFVKIAHDPRYDPDEENYYIIMAKRVSISES
jgi:ribosomal protein S18 acetylase RimI-like enzyme